MLMFHGLLMSVFLTSAQVDSPNARTIPPAASSAEASPDTQKAKELFALAQKLYKEGHYAQALAKFEAVQAVRPHPVVLFNIGKCAERLGQTAKALRSYRDYLRQAPEASSADKTALSASIVQFERRLREKGVQQLTILADPASARIAVDGKELGASEASVELTAGNHSLVVSAAGYETVARSFTMQLTRASEMTISLHPDRASASQGDAPLREPSGDVAQPLSSGVPGLVASSSGPARHRVWTYVAAGVAAASVGVAIGLGAAADGAAQDLRARERPHAEAQALFDQSQALANGANVTYGVAAFAAATAVVLFFVEK